MNNYIVDFNITDFYQIDNRVLQLHQIQYLGNLNDWFGNWRGGLFGFYNRLYGVKVSYDILHAWLPSPDSTNVEQHLASCFFNMDSSIECLTFALNSLGYAIANNDFCDISGGNKLKRISPKNIIGDKNDKNLINKPLPGYKKYFPTLEKLWRDKIQLIEIIMEQHDVSKHRETIFEGGKCRLDAPINFYETLGVSNEPAIRSRFWPMAEIILRNNPKMPRIQRKPQEISDFKYLEDLMLEYSDFIEKTGEYLLRDLNTYLVTSKID